MKKIFLTLSFLLLFVLTSVKTVKAENVDIYLFYGDGCPHCKAEKEYLNEIKNKYEITIHEYETWYNSDNEKLMTRVKNALGIENPYVPFTVIGNIGITGFNDSTKNDIEHKIKNYNNSENIVEKVLANPKEYDTLKENVIEDNNIKEETEKNNEKTEDNYNEEIKDIPLIGKVNVKKFSLPLIAASIGLVDGFNPCAMWILLFLISLLIGSKNRKRMWILGLSFLISSALVYALFMVAWLPVARLATSVGLIRIIIAIFALIAGLVNIISYLKKEDGCEIVDDNKRKRIFSKIKKFTSEKHLLLAVIGMVILAFTVNVVELACSAGLPLLFTQILAMNNLYTSDYILYIFIYILFFLLDDLIIFFIAMFTLKVTGFSAKYSKFSHLIGGIILFIIGILLIFNPEILMLGF